MAVEMFIYFKDKQCSLDGFALLLLCHQQGDVQDHHHYHLAHHASTHHQNHRVVNRSYEEHRQQLLCTLPALGQDDQVGEVFSIFLLEEKLPFLFFLPNRGKCPVKSPLLCC